MEEMSNSSKRPGDYLKELPPVPPVGFEPGSILANEYERVKSRTPMPSLDASRYGLQPPPQNRRNDVTAWKACVDNAHAQLEHQSLRILNLELMLKHGANNWRAQTQMASTLRTQLEEMLHAVRKESESVNRERKLQQTQAGAELHRLEQLYKSTLVKNVEIEAACAALEAQVHELKTQFQEHQPPSPTPPPPRASSQLDLTGPQFTSGEAVEGQA